MPPNWTVFSAKFHHGPRFGSFGPLRSFGICVWTNPCVLCIVISSNHGIEKRVRKNHPINFIQCSPLCFGVALAEIRQVTTLGTQ